MKKRCCICGKVYKTEKISPIKIEIGKNGVLGKTTIKKMNIAGKEISLCHKCLKAALLSATLISYLVDSSPVRLDVENYDGKVDMCDEK